MPGLKEMEWQLRLLQQRYATLARAKASFNEAEVELNYARKEFESEAAKLEVDALVTGLLEVIEGKIHAGA